MFRAERAGWPILPSAIRRTTGTVSPSAALGIGVHTEEVRRHLLGGHFGGHSISGDDRTNELSSLGGVLPLVGLLLPGHLTPSEIPSSGTCFALLDVLAVRANRLRPATD